MPPPNFTSRRSSRGAGSVTFSVPELIRHVRNIHISVLSPGGGREEVQSATIGYWFRLSSRPYAESKLETGESAVFSEHWDLCSPTVFTGSRLVVARGPLVFN